MEISEREQNEGNFSGVNVNDLVLKETKDKIKPKIIDNIYQIDTDIKEKNRVEISDRSGITSNSEKIVQSITDIEKHNIVEISDQSGIKSEEVVKSLVVQNHDQTSSVVVNKMISSTKEGKIQSCLTKDGRPKKYECKQCGKAFHIPSRLKNHLAKHSGERKYLCHICGAAFTANSNLRGHARSVHADVKSIQDSIKHRKIKKKEEIHTGERKYLCHICGAAFAANSNLRGHARSVHADVKSIQESIKHRKIKRKGPVKHECAQCGKVFAHAHYLENHIPVHSSERKFECSVCGTKFKRKIDLRTHIRIVHGNAKLHPCPKCEKVYKHVQSLNQHLRRHGGEKKYQCSICESAFLTRTDLNAHLHLQHGPGSFKCEFCGKVLATSDNLKKHKAALHNPVKPHECEICGERFGIKQLLTDHMHKHYLENVRKTEVDAPNLGNATKEFEKCSMCEYTCHHANDLQAHIILHEKKGMLTCDFCSQLCTDEIAISYHMRKHSKTKKFHCSICKESFSTAHALKGHLLRNYPLNVTNGIYSEFLSRKLHATSVQCGYKRRGFRTSTRYKLLHNEQGALNCKICNFSCKSNSTMHAHMKTHRKTKARHNTVCNASLRRTSALKDHMKGAHKDRCSTSTGYSIFPRVIVKYHYFEKVQDDVFKCKLCDQELKTCGVLLEYDVLAV